MRKYDPPWGKREVGLATSFAPVARALGCNVAFELIERRRSAAKLKSPRREPLKRLVQPTEKELVLALATEFLKRMGSRRMLALYFRANKTGDWADYETTKTKVNISGDDANPIYVRLPSKRHWDNRLFLMRMVARGLGDQKHRQKAEAVVQELENWLPASLQVADAAELDEKARSLVASLQPDRE